MTLKIYKIKEKKTNALSVIDNNVQKNKQKTMLWH